MDEKKYNVVFKGEIHEQATLSLVQERLASIFKADIEKIKIMFSKKRTIVKKHASYEVCQKVEQGFLNAGAFVDIEEIAQEVYEPEPVPPAPEYPPEPEYTTEPETEYAADSEYPPENEYEAETGSENESEYMPETEPEPENIENIEPDKGYTSEPESSPEDTLQPLEMENESIKADAEPELEEEIDEPSFGYAPLPEYKMENDQQSLKIEEESTKVEEEPDEEPGSEPDELTLGYDFVSDSETDYDSELVSEPEPEFEIVEDESEFEIVGVEPELEPEFESESDFGPDNDDLDYDFDSIQVDEPDSVDSEDSDFTEDELEENPYAAPQANLEQEGAAGENNFVYPQKRPFKNGIRWLLDGFALFKSKPVPWIVSVLIFGFVSTIMSIIPFIGSIIANILNPVFFAGFMIGAKEQDQGGSIRIGHVFAGFSNNFGQLILFGLLYFVTILLVFGLIGVVFVLIFVAGGLGSMNFADPSTFASLASISPIVISLIVLISMFVTVPIMMAYYFGPALISINQATIFDAIKMSFRACLSNMLPFLLYGITCMGLFIVFALIIGGVFALSSMLLNKIGIIIGVIVMIIMMLAIMPIFFASTYAAYKDIFYSE